MPNLVGRTRALNAPQIIPDTNIIGTKANVGTTQSIIYTVPAGKKAIITKYLTKMIALGANTFIAPRINTFKTRGNVTIVETVYVDEKMDRLVLLAGDTANFIGDNAANNGTIDFIFAIQELPV